MSSPSKPSPVVAAASSIVLTATSYGLYRTALLRGWFPSLEQPEHGNLPQEHVPQTKSSLSLRNHIWHWLPHRSDLPLWVGLVWFIVRPQPDQRTLTQSPSWARYWQQASDLIVLAILVPWKNNDQRNSRDDRSGSNNDRGGEEKSPNKAVPKEALPPSAQRYMGGSQSDFETAVRQEFAGRRFHLEPRSTPRSSATNLENMGATATQLPPMASTPSLSLIHPPTQSKRYLEILVHNVSHTDLVLSLDIPKAREDKASQSPDQESSYDADYCLCRPRFSAFAGYSQRVVDGLSSLANLSNQLISFPRFLRSDSNRIDDHPMAVDKHPIGIALKSPGNGQNDDSLQVLPENLSDLRIRGRDAPRVIQWKNATSLNAVFLPLLAMLLPQWQSKLDAKYASGGPDGHGLVPKKVLFLVSGVGSPRNWTHSRQGNSTQPCAQIMQRFVQTLYPDWVVVHVHSTTNIFRYDENISFVQNELMPCIHAYRDAHAKGLPYPDELSAVESAAAAAVADIAFASDWHKTMHVSLSFADGSPARNHAIQAALRPFKPTYFHCWQLKTFWHEAKIVDSDMEVHSFEEMETLPPIHTASRQLNKRPMVQQVVREMKAFKIEMEAILATGSNDIHTFWLRKSHKPVLAVLAVQIDGGPVKLYRGTNMEVSMPTGSLCAERNVIGTALADNPALKRHHLKLIAVLSVPHPGDGPTRPASTALSIASPPPVTTSSGLRASSMEVPSMPSQWPPLPNLTQRKGSSEKLPSSVDQPLHPSSVQSLSPATSAMTPPLPPLGVSEQPSPPPFLSLGESPLPSTSARRISLYQYPAQTQLSNSNNHQEKKEELQQESKRRSSRKTFVVVHSHRDLNPLRPCGACNEWLKKIAETNPNFQILTFTDADCAGVYCTPCADD